MPVFRVVFSSAASSVASVAPPDFSFNIEAASVDDALGLAEIEFARRHPQKLRSDYRAQLASDETGSGQRVQHFDRTAPLNPDQ